MITVLFWGNRLAIRRGVGLEAKAFGERRGLLTTAVKEDQGTRGQVESTVEEDEGPGGDVYGLFGGRGQHAENDFAIYMGLATRSGLRATRPKSWV